MSAAHAEASALIPVPPQVVYDLLRDYVDAHPAILPKPWFGALVVEQGGVGAGTTFTVTMKALGRETAYRMEVTEPAPMRLVEVDREKGIRTTFTVASEGFRARATIRTDWQAGTGFAGWLERSMTSLLLPHIYRQELALLEKLAMSTQMDKQLQFPSEIATPRQ